MSRSVLFGVLGVSLLAVAATAGLVSVNVLTTGANSAQTIQAAAAQPYIDQGKFYLTSHDILSARDQFRLAVLAEPANQEANLLYGVTRIAAVVEDGQGLNTAGLDSVREIFELAGFVFSKFSIYDSSYTVPQQLAPATPRTGAVLAFLKAKLLTEVDGAIANLAVVTNAAFASVIDPVAYGKSSGVTLTVDYADALVIKAFLQVLKCNLELVMVYGLDVSIPSIQAAPDQLMTYKQLFQDPTFLTPTEPARLATARTALLSFIDSYTLASQYLIARSGAAHHLFVIDVPVTNEAVAADTLGLNQFKQVLAEIKASLSGPYLYTFATGTEQNRFVDLSKFFDAANPINLRTKLSACAPGTPIPDPTLNGLFPLGLTGYESSLTSLGAHLLGVTCGGRETPMIEVEPSSQYLSDSPYLGPKSITIRNTGTATLNVSSISLVGPNSTEFTLAAGACGTLTPTVAPGSSCSVSIDLKLPGIYQRNDAALQIVSNDLFSPKTYVDILGYTSVPGQSLPPANYNLAVSVAGGGTVQGYADGPFTPISCPGFCSNSYPAGTFMRVAANADPGWLFKGWSGCDTTNGSDCYMGIFSVKNATATFIHDPRTLTVLASPPGGLFTSAPAITLAASKEAAIYFTLNGAEPTSGSTRYSGPFTLGGAKTLKYIAIDPFGVASAVMTENYTGFPVNATLSVIPSGSGGGTVNSIMPASGLVLCSWPHQPGDFCSTILPAGTGVTLSATPNATSLFTGWSLAGCPGTGNCSFTLGADSAVSATFITMPPVKVVGTSGTNYFTLLQDAYDHAPTGATIFTRAVTFPENLAASKPVSVTIKGGFDAGFATQAGSSLLQGKLTVGSGRVSIERLTVK